MAINFTSITENPPATPSGQSEGTRVIPRGGIMERFQWVVFTGRFHMAVSAGGPMERFHTAVSWGGFRGRLPGGGLRC